MHLRHNIKFCSVISFFYMFRGENRPSGYIVSPINSRSCQFTLIYNSAFKVISCINNVYFTMSVKMQGIVNRYVHVFDIA